MIDRFTVNGRYPFEIVQDSFTIWGQSFVKCKIQQIELCIEYYEKRGLHPERKLLKKNLKRLQNFKDQYPEEFL